MTLNITLLTAQAIFQSADFRLYDPDKKKIVSNTSTKLVTLQYGKWDGFVSYTGVGRWRRDTSEFIVEWLTGLQDATPSDVATRLCNRGTEWLYDIERASKHRYPHTFILAAFEARIPKLILVSNFEDLFGRNDANPAPALTISTRAFAGQPLYVVTGTKQAVTRAMRRRIKHAVRSLPVDPGRLRRLLASINEEASASPAARQTISPACSVISFRADGQGVCDVDGPVIVSTMAMGRPLPDMKDVAKVLGFDLGHLKGMTFASSKPRAPYAPCQPQTVVPPDPSGYRLRELRHERFESCRALSISNVGVVLGDGNPPESPGSGHIWTCPYADEPAQCGFLGNPGGINDEGEVAAAASVADGSTHAVRWREGGALFDLGCFRGRDSGAAAINSAGLVVGWVCIDPVNRGQMNFRPAAWENGNMLVLEDFCCDWGQAVDVNDTGLVLVLGYVGMRESRSILWNPSAGTTELIGAKAGVHPSAITADGTVLGTANTHEGKSLALIATPGQPWKQLGTPAGFYATAMNNPREVVGAASLDGYERPWLRRASGEIVWLPYFAHHWCRPTAINDSGIIVGTAQTDHGTHALVWTKNASEERSRGSRYALRPNQLVGDIVPKSHVAKG
jgi:hypothetical protein